MSAWRAGRERAWARFERLGLPGARDEDWKYTRLDPLVATLGERWWQPADAPAVGAADVARHAIPGLGAWLLVFAGGRYRPELSTPPPGVALDSLAALEAADEAAADAAAWLDDDEQAPMASGVWAVNAAMATDGVRLRVPRGVQVEKPVCLLHLAGGHGAAQLRHAIELGPGAGLHLIEHYAGGGDAPGLTHVVCRVRLGEGARLTHERLQHEADDRFHLARLDARLARDARLDSRVVTTGARFSRLDLLVDLAEAGAHCALDGLFMLGGRQHADHHTRIDHRAGHCVSREHYRGVLDGRARGVFNGSVVVHRGASGTDSAQHNANLLLSPRAHVDAKPELLIDHDDVKAAHGCTVGQLDPAQLFYLRSRGLGEEAARQLLVWAFADTILAGLREAAVRRYVERLAFSRLPNAGDVEGLIA